MEYRRFGRTELNPSVVGFGCGRIASLLGDVDRGDILRALLTAFQNGINFFDTADTYGQGDSERALGQTLSGRRDQIVICTKAGYRFGGPMRLMRHMKPLANWLLRKSMFSRRLAVGLRAGSPLQDFSPAYILRAIEGSLRRLNTDYIDLFLLHNPPTTVITSNVHAVFDTLRSIQRKGLIRYFGVSCASPADAFLCLKHHPDIAAVQVQANPTEPTELLNVLKVAAQQGVAVVARQPFGDGTVLDHPILSEFMANSTNRTPAQTILRFLTQLHGIGVVLVGMRSRSHVVENVAAIDTAPLTRSEICLLSRLYANQT